jgi:cytochrome c-type biogenesis protein CcmH
MTRFLVILTLFMTLAAAVTVPAAYAVEPDEVLADPALEARAREISQELRCVVCQNQSIDDSHAGIARDLRILVRERLVAGDSDKAVLDYVVARYGDYVLLNPPFKPQTWALWIGPPVMAAAIVLLIVMSFRRWQTHQAEKEEIGSLSPTDRAELDALVERIARTAPPPPPRSALRAELEEPRTPPGSDRRDTATRDPDAMNARGQPDGSAPA